MSGAVLAVWLALPATLRAAEPSSPPSGSGTPAGAEQPSPPTSPTLPPAPPTDPATRGAQPPVDGPASDLAARRRRGSSGGDPGQRSTLASGSAAARSGSVSVVGDTFSSFAFSPKSITVHTGDTVRWVNKSAAPEGHTVTGDGLDSGTFHQGEDYSHTFSKPGKYSYICALHPSMKGKVVVQGSSGGEGGSQSSGGGGGGSPSGSGSSSGGTPGAGFGGGSSAVDPGGSAQLPVTGLPLIGLGMAGLGLVVAGLLLRRWTEYGWYY